MKLHIPVVVSLLYLVSNLNAEESCGETRLQVERGLVRLPELEINEFEEVNCTWYYTAPPGYKLLVKLDLVQLLPENQNNSSLELYLDERSYEVPYNCVQCLPELLNGESLQINFYSSPLPNVTRFRDLGAFQIRFKSFNPFTCERPLRPENGYIIGKEWSVNKEIVYYCNPQFDLIGKSSTSCVSSETSPEPSWTSPPPRCIPRDCSRGPIQRKAGVGAIASPGYPSSIPTPVSSCQWEISANPGQQIRASLSYLHLANKEAATLNKTNSLKLALYDGNISSPIANLSSSITTEAMNFTTWTNKLIVHFFVSDMTPGELQLEQMGFYLEYSAIPGFCPDPGPPLNGELIAYSFSLGSAIAFRCLYGFQLIGDPQSECLASGNWSAPKPSCEPITESPTPLLAVSNSSETIGYNTAANVLVTNQPKSFKTKLMPSANKEMNFAIGVKSSDEKTAKDQEGMSSSNKTESLGDRKKSRKEEHELLELNAKTSQKIWQSMDKHKKAASKKYTQDTALETVFTEEEVESPPVLHPTSRPNLPSTVPMNIILVSLFAGVVAPLIVAMILLVALVMYRRKYPVRMRFGRKFSTFENPMYAQHPRELSRLSSPDP